ncbi:hypothetical protein GCM10011494_06850 [Novosphingobium endophyticum]|uniref:Uncharacterized protein n=1 Tax=Novosphingobium endophyticum TaxID=1955250 RepID=A0A916X3E6_9SPHN|nr:hypothetical protein [Novosphingobium endophyticum]GGB91124.1 hypothetical protein GCM10011494_06850 [Novosphingobium endophyticum]
MKNPRLKGLARRVPWMAGPVLAVAIAVLSGCTTPPPPPPPPPPVVVIPPKPTPPMGAPDEMTIPPANDLGVRQTVNSGISTSQAVWNLRSAYNVAALNCIEVQYAPILEGYKRFLTVYAKALNSANREIDKSFRTQHVGRAAIVARETYQTQVYNFFSLPPVDAGFCQAAMDLTTELQTVDPSQFEAYSFTGLAKMEAPFKAFFDAFEQYRADLAAWQSRYGGGLLTVRPTFEQQAEIGQQAAQPSVTLPAPTAAPPQPAITLPQQAIILPPQVVESSQQGADASTQ